MAIEYYEGSSIRFIGRPIMVVVTHEVPDTHVLVVEWYLYLLPLRGRIRDIWYDRILHRPKPGRSASRARRTGRNSASPERMGPVQNEACNRQTPRKKA